VISENSKESKDIIGHVAKIKVIKNKVATPFKTCNVNIIYGRGIDYELDLLDVATKIKMIEKSGSWYTYGDNRLGNGSVQAAQFLKENTDVSGELDQHIRSKFMDTDNTEQDNTEQDNTEQDNTEQESENVDVESDI
jgi:recombination protein RecA